MTTFAIRLLPIAVLAATAAAQSLAPMTTVTTTRLASYDRTFGDSEWGGTIAMDSSAWRRVNSIAGAPYSTSLRIDDSVVGRVRLDGHSREAAAVTTFGQVGGGLGASGFTRSYAAGLALRVGGQTVLAPTLSGTQTEPIEWDLGTNTLTFLDITIPVPVGPATVDVRLRAFARSSINVVLSIDPEQLTMELTGNLRAVATADADASTNFVVARVGVLTTLDLMETRLSPSVGVTYANGPFGAFNYRVEPARFRIRPYIEYWRPFLGWDTIYATLVDENWGLITGSRTLQL